MFDMEVWTFWTWAGIGLVLAIGEMILPGVFLIWLGSAALVTSLIVALIPELSWYTQLGVFGVLAVVSIFVGRRYYRGRESEDGGEGLNQRGDRLVGQEFELIEDIRNGVGRVQVGDSPWRVHGPNGLTQGTTVRVVSVDGSALKVEAVQ
ncbi:MAG: NfeD family protein [Sphingomonadales bacterium]|jgi:membrane protein implicated in regulation of membrane protease activity